MKVINKNDISIIVRESSRFDTSTLSQLNGDLDFRISEVLFSGLYSSSIFGFIKNRLERDYNTYLNIY